MQYEQYNKKKYLFVKENLAIETKIINNIAKQSSSSLSSYQLNIN